mgnify:CR=1 FL=1
MAINLDIPKFPSDDLKKVSPDAYNYIASLHAAIELLAEKVDELESEIDALSP